jgi:hypothetical protein
MKKRIVALLVATHGVVAMFGFALGIYLLPILTAPPSPSESEINAMLSQAIYSAEFKKDLKDSDALHWGEGRVSIASGSVAFVGELAPGPAYKLYFSPQFVETEADFMRLKSSMVQVADIKTFDSFLVDIPPAIDPSKFNSVIVWCESFEQFITSAQYR